MSDKTSNKRLGKGIEALFSANSDLDLTELVNEIEETENYQVKEINLKKLRANPYQPRKEFEEEALNELSQSIKEHGVIQPIVVRKSSFGYDILAGERRFRAAKMANLETIPAVVKNFSDNAMMELALLENIQREDLNIIEEARGYQSLLETFTWTQKELATRMGKSRSHVTNILRLLELPESVQQLLLDKKITMGHTKILLGLEEAEIIALANQIVADDLSVRAAEKLVQQAKTPKQSAKKVEAENDKHAIERAYVAERLIEYLGTKVELTNKKLVVNFADDNELNRILTLIGFNGE